MTMRAEDVEQQLYSIADPNTAEHSQRFFKTGKNEYGEGDRFLGIRVPDQRKIARQFKNLSLTEAEKLLNSGFHEVRLTSLLILAIRFEKSDDAMRKRIYDLVMLHIERINNWDLIDLAAPKIIGAYLYHSSRSVLYELAGSSDFFKRRIAIMATFYFIRQGDFRDTLAIAETLVEDEHDLVQKAVGWMLREIGKREQPVLEEFLREYHHRMPRTMLRYAIEKMPEAQRVAYLRGIAQT